MHIIVWQLVSRISLQWPPKNLYYTWRHIRLSYLYLAGLEDQPPATFKWLYIIFDERIEILTLKNLYFDLHEGIYWLYLYLAGLQDQPPAASKWPEIIFDVRIEILTLKKLYLDIHEDILEFDLHICTWPASRISLQWPLSGLMLFLMRELKSWP